MPRDYPIPHDIPVDRVAARTMRKGTEIVWDYKPNEWRSHAPLPIKSPPDPVSHLTGQKRGDLLIVGYIGKSKWLAKCVCGYYVTRKTRFLLREEDHCCEECDYRDFIRRSLHAERTGVWPERRRNSSKKMEAERVSENVSQQSGDESL